MLNHSLLLLRPLLGRRVHGCSTLDTEAATVALLDETRAAPNTGQRAVHDCHGGAIAVVGHCSKSSAVLKQTTTPLLNSLIKSFRHQYSCTYLEAALLPQLPQTLGETL